MVKAPIAFRLSEEAHFMLDRMATETNQKKTDLLEAAIREKAMRIAHQRQDWKLVFVEIEESPEGHCFYLPTVMMDASEGIYLRRHYVDFTEHDGEWQAHVRDMEGIAAAGRTMDETKARLKEAIIGRIRSHYRA